MRTRYVFSLALLPLVLCACTPGVRVKKNPSDHDDGIRYYRPKPYLFISPASKRGEATTDGKGNTTVKTELSDQVVSIQLQYLPDFSEEYSIKVRPGLGTADVGITLENGWNLTSINQKLDSQFDENLNAVANLATAASKFAGASKGVGDQKAEPRDFVVQATNIPLGYYEAVIGRDGAGRKRHFGWRYVGFAPFNACPLDMCGSECTDCNTRGVIYGLVFYKGVMTFKELGNIDRDGNPVKLALEAASGTTPASKKIENAENKLRTNLETKFNTIGFAEVKIDTTKPTMEVTIITRIAVSDSEKTKIKEAAAAEIKQLQDDGNLLNKGVTIIITSAN